MPGDVAEPDRQQPAGRRRQGGQPRLGAGDERGGREDGRLRSTGRARGQDRDGGRGGIRGGRDRGRPGAAPSTSVVELEHRSASSHRAVLEARPGDDDTRRERPRRRRASSRPVRPRPDRRGHRPDPGDPVQRGDRRRRRRGEQGDPIARLEPRRRSSPSATASARRSSSAHVQSVDPSTTAAVATHAPGPRRRAAPSRRATATRPSPRRHRERPDRIDPEPLERPHIQDDPEPARRRRRRARASGRPRRCSERASRSCSSSPAVASPWSSGSGQRADATSGKPCGDGQRRGDPDPRLEQRADDDRHAARRSERGDLGDGARPADARRLDDDDVDRVRLEQAADVAHGRRGLVGRDRDADATAQLGHAVDVVRRRAAARRIRCRSARSPPVGRSRSSRSQAPLTSSRSAMSGPTAARIARTRSTSTSVSRSAPALTLSVTNPDSTDCERRLGRRLRTERRERGIDADATVVVVLGRNRPRPGRARALSSAAASARPGAPCISRSASEGSPSAAPSTASRTSASRIVSATSPFAGSSTASPSPTRPSSSTSRRIHASRSTHIPVAVGNGRRNGIRTRSATSDRRRHAIAPPIARPGREQQPVDERQAGRALEHEVELARLRERPDGAQQRRRHRQREERQEHRQPATGRGERDRHDERHEQEPGVFEPRPVRRPASPRASACRPPCRSGCRAGC